MDIHSINQTALNYVSNNSNDRIHFQALLESWKSVGTIRGRRHNVRFWTHSVEDLRDFSRKLIKEAVKDPTCNKLLQVVEGYIVPNPYSIAVPKMTEQNLNQILRLLEDKLEIAISTRCSVAVFKLNTAKKLVKEIRKECIDAYKLQTIQEVKIKPIESDSSILMQLNILENRFINMVGNRLKDFLKISVDEKIDPEWNQECITLLKQIEKLRKHLLEKHESKNQAAETQESDPDSRSPKKSFNEGSHSSPGYASLSTTTSTPREDTDSKGKVIESDSSNETPHAISYHGFTDEEPENTSLNDPQTQYACMPVYASSNESIGKVSEHNSSDSEHTDYSPRPS